MGIKMEKKKLSLKEIGIEKLVIMLLCGIFLIVLSLPGNSSNSIKQENTIPTDKKIMNTQKNIAEEDATISYINRMEEKLKNTLKKVEGIGNVEVMITVRSSGEQIPLKDSPFKEEETNENDGVGGSRISSTSQREEASVLVKEDSGKELPYIIKELQPEVNGIVVIAEGGGQMAVKNEIIEAAEVLFSLPAHKIKVMKMN